VGEGGRGDEKRKEKTAFWERMKREGEEEEREEEGERDEKTRRRKAQAGRGASPGRVIWPVDRHAWTAPNCP
jgi:hypothetical protein